MTSKKMLLMAAVAGMAIGAAQPTQAQENNTADVKCFGVNSCKAHAGCSVTDEQVAAVKSLLGDKSFKERFGKTRTHSCGAHASCGASSKFLNWTSISEDSCKEQSGYVVEEKDGKLVARQL